MVSDTTSVLEELVGRSIGRDVPPEIARDAAAVTRRALRLPEGAATAQTRRRIEAYFSAVVRRRVVKRGAAPKASARLVVASVVADLRSTGRSGADIWEELQRGWAQRIPVDVLEEYRLQLCG